MLVSMMGARKQRGFDPKFQQINPYMQPMFMNPNYQFQQSMMQNRGQ